MINMKLQIKKAILPPNVQLNPLNHTQMRHLPPEMPLSVFIKGLAPILAVNYTSPPVAVQVLTDKRSTIFTPIH